MQKDMHFYGTYAMARAAGLNLETCKIIATAAQYIDDNAADGHVVFKDAGRINPLATAHHPVDKNNINENDQRKVWVPFHFFPGNKGESFTERLICQKDSDLVREMLDNHLANSDKAFAIELMGVAAHVYADTFSHYGFSGVSSRQNLVVNDSYTFDSDLDPNVKNYIFEKSKKFFQSYKKEMGIITNIKSWVAETLSHGLGHGGVATFPDRPYLKWGFEYEHQEPKKVFRDNPTTFLEGCEALHNLFIRFGELRPDLKEDGAGRSFIQLEGTIKTILAHEGPCDDRSEKWKKEISTGAISGIVREDVPEYDENEWHTQFNNMNESADSNEALSQPVYRFFQAAAFHRTYVLRDLLPRHNLIVN